MHRLQHEVFHDGRFAEDAAAHAELLRYSVMGSRESCLGTAASYASTF